MTRRSLLMSSAACLAATQRAVRLGGPIYLKSDDPRELAREHRRLGYAAAYCPNADVQDGVRTKAIAEAFAAENVVIAEVGAWKNMLDPDAAKRKENLDYVMMRLALAEAVGARCCVDIAGSFHPTVWYGAHKDNVSPRFFDATVENVRKVIDAVKPKRTTFSVEMMGWSIPDSADSYLKLLKAVDRKQFSVHVDVCNIINSPERIYNNAAVIEDVFRKLGRWVSSCHAKDLAWVAEMNVHFVEVIPGRGEIDYRAYLRSLAGIAADAPLMLEHLKTAAEYEEGAAYIRKTAAACGVTLA
ncbi:MAG: sugar phosphate isomerase/epimerase [Acidobacteria bacterium]|nr:sugar phosphate isomerase/epimerase [Acidobacteriota bacterium]